MQSYCTKDKKDKIHAENDFLRVRGQVKMWADRAW